MFYIITKIDVKVLKQLHQQWKKLQFLMLPQENLNKREIMVSNHLLSKMIQG